MSGLSRDPERAAEWAMRSRKPLRRTPMKRGGRIRQQGAKANRERPALDAFRTAIAQRSRGLCQPCRVIRQWLAAEERIVNCPTHRTRLVLDERTTDTVPDGLGPLGAERTFVVERFVCPVTDCAELEERVA